MYRIIVYVFCQSKAIYVLLGISALNLNIKGLDCGQTTGAQESEGNRSGF